ncbi:MAG: hypothetical protein ACUVWX_13185 [Kiritimatiellia bacterium]
MKKTLGAFVMAMAGLVISCAPINLIFVGTNTESSTYDLLAMRDTIIPFNGESWHGALYGGQTLVFYSRTDSVPLGGHLQVYNKLDGYAGLPVGYYNVDDPLYTDATARMIRDQYLEWYPVVSAYWKSQIPVSWDLSNPQFPQYRLVVFPQVNAGAGTVHRINLVGVNGGPPALRVVDDSGVVVGKMEPIGRTLLLREASQVSEPKIVSHNMSKTAPGSPAPNPSISVDFELGYVSAAVIQELTPGCYDGPQIAVKTQVNYDPLTFLYTYNFYPVEPLVPGLNYVLFLGTQSTFGWAGPGGPIEKLTQGLNSGEAPLDCSEGALCPPGWGVVDLGSLACGASSGTMGHVYYFQAGSTWWGGLIPPPPPGTLVPGVSSYVMPREIAALECGDVSVVITFPPDYDIRCGGQEHCVDDMKLGCAHTYQIVGIPGQNAVIGHFHCNETCAGDLENSTIFVTGTTTNGLSFIAHDTVKIKNKNKKK